VTVYHNFYINKLAEVCQPQYMNVKKNCFLKYLDGKKNIN